jgi:DNA-binding CsgD family transcriptional regulator
MQTGTEGPSDHQEESVSAGTEPPPGLGQLSFHTSSGGTHGRMPEEQLLRGGRAQLAPSRFAGTTLRGRGEELRPLDDFLVESMQRTTALLLLGEVGVGKTALVEEVVRIARNDGVRVVQARGNRAESVLSHAGALHLLAALGSGESSGQVRQRPTGSGERGSGVAGGRLAMGLAVLEQLTRAAEIVPTLIVIDDVHWFDDVSLDALVFAVRRLQHAGIGVLLAGRRTSATLGLADDLPTLVVPPLRQDASEELLDTKGLELPAPLLRRVLAEAGGNPAALLAIATGVQHPGFTQADLLSPRLPLDERLAGALAEVLNDLPPASRTLLLLAAQANSLTLPRVLAAAEGLGVDAVDLGPAEEAGLVRVDGLRLVFTCPLVQSAVYWSAPFAERRRAHLALAEILRTEPYQRAVHLASATTDPDEASAAELERAAEEAFQHGAVLEISPLLERAADLSTEDEPRARRLVAAAVHAALTGQTAATIRLVNDALRLPLDNRTEVSLQALEGLAAYTTDSVPTHALPALVGSMELSVRRGENFPLATQQLADQLHGTLDTQAWAGRLRKLIGGGTLREMISVSDSTLLMVYVWSGSGSRLPSARAAIKAAVTQVPPGHQLADLTARAAAVLATVAMDEPEATRHLGLPLLEELLSHGLVSVAMTVFTSLQISALHRGKPSEVESLAARGQGLAEAVGDGPSTMAFKAALAHVKAWQGDAAAVAELTEEVLAYALPRGHRLLAARCHWSRGLLALEAGRPAEAWAELRPLVVPGGEAAHWIVSRWALGDIVAAAEAGEDTEALLPMLDHIRDESERSGSRLDRQLAARSRAILDQDGQAEEHFQAALVMAQHSEWPFEEARTCLAYGVWLRRQRRLLEARAELERARSLFNSVGAQAWTSRATSEFRATRPVTAFPSEAWVTRYGLTSREAEVAKLAAGGLSNQEIGWQLGLAPRTVASHLSRLFPKMGVNSRGELPEALEY